jgi:hypothetical protein
LKDKGHEQAYEAGRLAKKFIEAKADDWLETAKMTFLSSTNLCTIQTAAAV